MAATKWATDSNVAIAAQLTAPPKALAAPTSLSAVEKKKWKLRDLRRAAAHPHLWTLGTATAGAAGWGMDALCTATVSGTAGTLAGLGVTGTTAAVTAVTRLAKRKAIGPAWPAVHRRGCGVDGVDHAGVAGRDLVVAAGVARDRGPGARRRILARPARRASRPPGPRAAAGTDGNGYVPWKFFDGDGAWSGVVVGGTGGGKSSLIDVLAISARAAGMSIGYIDPQSGSSSPVMTQHASFIALGPEQLIPAIEALEEMGRTREKWLALHPKLGGAIVPGKPVVCEPGCRCGGVAPPGMIVFIDECDLAFNMTEPGTSTKIAARFAALAKKIRKLGVGFVGATQIANLGAFGNNDLLRSSLATKNLIAFHTSSSLGGKLIPGLPTNPKDLPKKKGYAIIAGETSRTAPLRTFFSRRQGKDGRTDTCPRQC
jgi:hypothetical protein